MTHVFNAEIWLCDIPHSIVCDLGAVLDQAGTAVSDFFGGTAPAAADAAGTAGQLSSTAADAAAAGASGAADVAPVATDAASTAIPAALTEASIGGQDIATALGVAPQAGGAAGAIAPPAIDPASAFASPVGQAIAPVAPAVAPPGAAPVGIASAAGPVAAPASVPFSGPDATAPAGLDKTATDAFNADTAGGARPSAIAAGENAFGASGIKPSPDSSFTKFLNDPAGTIGGGLVNNPGAVLGAGILGFEALNQPTIPGASAAAGNLSSAADKLASQGNSLIGPNAATVGSTAGNLTTQGTTIANDAAAGKLPPGLEQQLTTAAASAKATIRSQYASRGMSGSSAEQQDLANVDNQIAAQRGTLAQSLLAQGINEQSQGASLASTLLSTGIQETGLSTALYESILKDSLAQDASLSDALAKFAAGLAGGGGQTIKVSAA
jgi:hypothetical protein